MVITIFGASGGIGKHAVDYALRKGYKVRAYLRNPQKLNIQHENLSIIQGELSDYDSVKKVVEGTNAIIWCVGISMKRHKDRDILEAHKVLLKAMKACQVKRLINWATPSVKFEKDIKSFLTIVPGIGASFMFPDTKKELVEITDLITASDLEWTIVRFLMPTDEPAIQNVKVSFGEKKIKFAIPRANIGAFMVNQVEDSTYIRNMPIIGS